MLVSVDGGLETGTKLAGIVVPGGNENYDVIRSYK